MPNGKGVSTSFFVSFFILLFGLSSVLSAQSAPRGSAAGSAVINAETWDNLGGGVTGEVFALAQMGDYLYVGGDITAAGGNPVNNIARYDLVGSGGWEALGFGTNDRVNSLVAHNGVLYVGGFFTEVNGSPVSYLATWDGTSWSAPADQPVLTGSLGQVSSMLILDDFLYVGGDFDQIGSLSTTTIARYPLEGGSWEAITPNVDFFSGDGCTVPAMATDGTSIYLSVPCAAEIGGQSYSGLFSYTPGTQTWAAVGEGLDELSAPLSLAVSDGFLYAGGPGMYEGDFDSTVDIEFFGRYDLSVPSVGWASLGNPLDDVVNDFVIIDGSAYVVGQFTSIDADQSIGMAVFNIGDLEWTSIGNVDFDGGAINYTISLVNNQLVVGGVINNAGETPVSNVARYSQTFSGGGSGGDGGGDGGAGGTPTFTLTAPTDGLTGVSVEPLFTWNAPVGVTVDYYMLEIFDNPTLTAPAYFQNDPFDPITTTTYQYDGSFFPLPGNTTFYWRVTGYNNLNEVVAETEAPFSFTTESLELSTPTLVAPVGIQDVSLTPTFTWSKDALAESYVLEYSTGATLSDTPTQLNLALGDLNDADPNYSYTLPGGSELETNTQYSWRVIAQKAGEDDMPSAEASFTTVDLSPGAFTWDFDPLERIVDGSIENFNTSWTQSDGATSYELDFKIGEQPFTAFGDPVVVNAPTTSYSVDITELIDGFTYTVELTAVNEYGRTPTDPLTIVYTPTKPVAVSPKDGAAVDATTSFTWESTENFGNIPGNVLAQILYTNDENADPVANSSDGIQFDFLGTTDVEESKTFTELFATQNDVDVSQFLEANMGNTLYWRVSNKSIRINEADAETQREVVWSDLASFSIPAVPQAFNLSTPTNNSTVETFLPTFTWQQSQNATSYKLQIATQTNFSDPIYESPLIGRGDNENTVTYTLPEGEELDFLTGYFWRVIASSDGGDLTSGHFTFETHFGRYIEIVSPDDGLTYESVAQAGAAEYSWPHIFGDADEFYYATQFFIDEARVLGDRADVISEGNVIGPNPINTLRSGFTYNWYVEGYASYSGSRDTPYLTSDSRTFTIEAEKPTVTVPVAQALLASNTMFSWSAEETIQLMDGGRIEGDFDIQLLTVNDPNADPQTNPDDGYHFTMRGLSNALNESNTLAGLVSLNENVTLDDILSREGETLYFRVRINPEYSLLTQERVTLWSDLIPVRVPASPQAFELLTPANPSSDISVTPTFTWEQSDNAETYVLSISTDGNMADPVFTSTSFTRGDDPDEVSFELPSEDRLLFGETYFWQVTASAEGGDLLSGISRFSTLPEEVVLTNPENGRTFTSASAVGEETFTWEHYLNADLENITSSMIINGLVESGQNFSGGLITRRGGGINSYTPSPTNLLMHGFTYTWIVQSDYWNEDNTVSYDFATEPRSFSIAPEVPILAGAVDGAEITSKTPLNWTIDEQVIREAYSSNIYNGEFHVQILFDQTTDADELTADQGYQFLVDGTDELTESFTLEQLFATLEGDDAPTIDDLMSRAGQTLYWRVKIDPEYPELEQDREVVWSDVESFVLAEIAPITLLSPGASDSDVPENVTLRPTFSWDALTDLESVYYILEVSKNEDFSTLFGSSTSQQTSSILELDLDGPATYYWRVKAIIGANGSEIVGQSATRSFKTNTNIEIVSLDNEATNVDLDSVFEWYSNDSQFFLSIQEPGTGKTLAVNSSPTKRYTLQEAIDNRVITDSETFLNTLEPNKTYNWFVSSFDERLNHLGQSETRTFTTSVYFGAEPPVFGEVEILTQRSVRLSWTGNATTYLIQVAEKIDNEETISWMDVGFETGLTAVLTGLDAGKTYLWRVSSVSSEGDVLATSEIGEFIIPKAPDVITVSYPLSTDENVPVSGINFQWEPDANATQYHVLVYESTNLNVAVIDKTVDAIGDNTGIQSAQFDDVASLKYSTEYKWRVIGYNGIIRGELNVMSSFTTEINRSIILVGPTQQAPNQTGDYQFEFTVTTSGFPNGTNAFWEIVTSRDDLSANGPNSESSVNYVHNVESAIPGSIKLPESTFDDGQTYYWRVSTQAENSDGYISSEIGEFTVTRTPAQPVITSPAATNVPITGVIFTWNTDPFADAYQLTLREKDGEQTFDVTVPAIIAQSQSYSLNNQQRLFNNTEYEFSVTAINGDRVGFTRTLTFRTVAATSTKVRLSYSMELTWVLTNPNTLFKSKVANEICEKLDLDTSECSRIEVVTSTAKDTPSEPDLINAGDAIILLIWEQPETPEEFPITHYSIQYRPAGADYWNQFSRPESPDTIAVFTGFDPETRYDIRIAGVNENGIGEYSESIEVETISMEDAIAFIEAVAAEIIATSIEVEEIPTEFTLFQNYPNPFNPTTTVRFALPEPSEVQLEVYSILGQRIAVLSTGLKPAGYHSVQLDASRWASGTYIYRLRAGDRIFTKKLLLIK